MIRWQASRYVPQKTTDTMSKEWSEARTAEEALIARDDGGPVGSPQCNIVARFIRKEDRDEAIRIVNAHDALVAALEAVQKGVPDVLRRECLNQIVEDALALARGGK